MLLNDPDIIQRRLDVMQKAIQDLQSKLTAQEQKNAQQEALIQKLVNGTHTFTNPVLSKITCNDNCCPDGYTKHHDACYRIFVEYMSWPEAVTICGTNGAHLVRIETKSEYDFLSSWLISNQAKIRTTELWIAGMEIEVEGEWVWPETMDRITYLPWGPGENPNDSRYNCVCMSHTYQYGYADIECDRKINFICEINLHGSNE